MGAAPGGARPASTPPDGRPSRGAMIVRPPVRTKLSEAPWPRRPSARCRHLLERLVFISTIRRPETRFSQRAAIAWISCSEPRVAIASIAWCFRFRPNREPRMVAAGGVQEDRTRRSSYSVVQ